MAHQVPDFWAVLFEAWRETHADELARAGIVDIMALAPNADSGEVQVYFTRSSGTGYVQLCYEIPELFTPPSPEKGDMGEWIEALIRPLLYRHKTTANTEAKELGTDAIMALSQLEGHMGGVWQAMRDTTGWLPSGARTAWARLVFERAVGRTRTDALLKSMQLVSIVEPREPDDVAILALRCEGREFNLAFRDLTEERLGTRLPLLVVERNDRGTVSYMSDASQVLDIVSDTLLKLARVQDVTGSVVIRRGSAIAVSEALRFMYSTVATMWLERNWKPEAEKRKKPLAAEYTFFDDGFSCLHTVSWRRPNGYLELAMSIRHASVVGALDQAPDLQVGLDVGNAEGQSDRRVRAGDVDWADALSKASETLLGRVDDVG